jgi:hypothetical protein
VADDVKRAAAVQAMVPITHTLYVDGRAVCLWSSSDIAWRVDQIHSQVHGSLDIALAGAKIRKQRLLCHKPKDDMQMPRYP